MRLFHKRLHVRSGWVLLFLILSAIFLIVLVALLKLHPLSVSQETDWAIGIYEGTSPLELVPAIGVANPVIRSSDIKDIKADFVSDPFMVNSGGTWYMFFEVMNSLTRQGDIGCALSRDGLRWEYKKIVLDEPFHLSYPYVFQWQDQFYMIPESSEFGEIRLYQACPFPYTWKAIENLIPGEYADSSVFFFNKTWWMLSFTKLHPSAALRLFYADNLTGPWIEHPASPVIQGDDSRSRPGGRILVTDSGIIRFAQDDLKTYGKRVMAFFISEISRTRYVEREYDKNPILQPQSKGWNRHGMHHIDAHQLSPGKWIAAVDGYRKSLAIRIEY